MKLNWERPKKIPPEWKSVRVRRAQSMGTCETCLGTIFPGDLFTTAKTGFSVHYGGCPKKDRSD